MRPSFQFCWMWIFLWIKLSRHSCSMWDKLGWLIDSGNFSVGSYIPLIWKDSITHMHGLVVYVKEGLSFALSFVWKSLVFQIVGWSLKYYFDRCSSELAQVVPLPYSRGRSTHYSDRLHDFSVPIPNCYKDVYVNSYFPCRARLWNSLPIECFPLTHNLSDFKSRIKRHFLTLGSF